MLKSGILLVLSVCVVIAAGVSAAQSPDGPIVATTPGSLQGATDNDVDTFKGIPFAQPPVGDLRWRAPQPLAPWDGVRAATTYAPSCLQATPEPTLQTTLSEDCLYLNVWRPADTEAEAGLPVLVWIHGGGFVNGGGSDLRSDGSAFAREGIVVVSLQYRLGRLGFFAHPALIAADEGPVGNFGYMDQIAGLKWVQDNIAAFGGDPQRVTLVGESAGGASVLTMLTSPEAEGLFQQVMVMSGGGRQGLVMRPMTGGTPENPSADEIDAAFAESQGIDGNDADALAALRALPAETLVGDLNLEAVLNEGLRCVAQDLMNPGQATPCVPKLEGTQMIDGTIVTAAPEDVIKSGGAANVPIIIGTTAVDLPEYFPPVTLNPLSYFGADAEAARAAYNVPEALDAQGLVLLLAGIGADITMHEPARFVAREMTAAGNPAWLYRFTYLEDVKRPSIGQVHAGEVPFLFETLDARYPGEATDNDRAMAHQFNAYVANFVKTGDPNGDDLPAWPAFDPAQHDLMNFSMDDGPVFGPDPRAGVALVERVADAQTE
jgi:para-nitrobenzyl esterase